MHSGGEAAELMPEVLPYVMDTANPRPDYAHT